MVLAPVAPSRAKHAPPRPALESGDRMDREEFERRYNGRPDIKKAELIKGVVYVASPVRIPEHAAPHFELIGHLNDLRKAFPGVVGADNGTFRCSDGSEVQPDIILRRTRRSGGTSWLDSEHYVNGSPEFVAEVSASSASYDLHAKKDLYREVGVREYLVWQTEENVVQAWTLRDGQYVAIEPDSDGRIHSLVFPGMVIDPGVLFAGVSEVDEGD